MPDISDEELKVLKGAQTLLDQLVKSPKTKRTVEKAIKELHPNVTTTDDIADEIVAPYKKRIEALEARFDKDDEGRLDTKFNNDLDWLRSDEGGNYTEDGIEKIKQIMVKESIPNARAAAAWWEKLNPPQQQEASILTPSDWGIGKPGGGADLDLLWKDEDAWADKEAAKVFAESRKNGQIIT